MAMNKSTMAVITSLALLIGFSHSALARYNMCNGMNFSDAQSMQDRRGYRMNNLTVEQQTAREAALTQFQTSTADLRQQLLSKRYQYHALLTSHPVDEQNIVTVSKEIQALQDTIHAKRQVVDTQLIKAGVPIMDYSGMHRGRGYR